MERLQKVIANSGYTSRRKAEKLILDGLVTVNGNVVKELGVKVSRKDEITVEGQPLTKENLVYYLLYKPRGVLSAASDKLGRETVVDYLPMVKERIYPIGRLDYDTTGLILLTNDGDFANLMMHPSGEIDKTYVARLKGCIHPNALKRVSNGVMIDGRMTHKAKTKVRKMDRKTDSSTVEITIHEGRNHQVKKMFEAVGFPVKRLKRERFAFLTLDGLKTGEHRSLKPHEIKQLKLLASKKL